MIHSLEKKNSPELKLLYCEKEAVGTQSIYFFFWFFFFTGRGQICFSLSHSRTHAHTRTSTHTAAIFRRALQTFCWWVSCLNRKLRICSYTQNMRPSSDEEARYWLELLWESVGGGGLSSKWTVARHMMYAHANGRWKKKEKGKGKALCADSGGGSGGLRRSRWTGPGGQEVFFCHRTSVLIQPRPCSVSVGVSEAAAGPLAKGGGDVHYIQLLFHPTELLSAAAVSQSLEFCSFMEVKEHRHSKRNK